ncbi:MAG: redoxin domain-containing protein [Phycisphaeraceae bacterium]|nr:redoxin domain-containing protein [Phycisphaeraceae bacterium]
MTRNPLALASLALAFAFGGSALAASAPLGAQNQGSGGAGHKSTDSDGTKKEKKDGSHDGKAVAKVGEKAPDFHFTDLDGKSHSLAEFSGKTVVLQWMHPGCPICRAKFEGGAVKKMMDEIHKVDADTVFIFVNSTRTEDGGSVDASRKYLENNKIEGIAFWEGQGTVGRLYDAKTTPHLYVIDKKGVLAYAGAIDDDRSGKKGVNYVVEAVKALNEGRTPSPATTNAYGCTVKYAKN